MRKKLASIREIKINRGNFALNGYACFEPDKPDTLILYFELIDKKTGRTFKDEIILTREESELGEEYVDALFNRSLRQFFDRIKEQLWC